MAYTYSTNPIPGIENAYSYTIFDDGNPLIHQVFDPETGGLLDDYEAMMWAVTVIDTLYAAELAAFEGEF